MSTNQLNRALLRTLMSPFTANIVADRLEELEQENHKEQERAQKAEAELAALREDKARLDWLATNVHSGNNHKRNPVSHATFAVWDADKSLRAALDAARKEAGDDEIMRQHLREGGTPT